MSRESTTCAWHSDRPAIGTRNVKDESGAVVSSAGACVECAVDLGAIDGPFPAAVARISNGAPCRCGPGFCANAEGLGFYGFCAGSRTTAGPDACGRCGAPHQSDGGCWLCSRKSGSLEAWEIEECKAWVRAFHAGVTGREIFARQNAAIARGEFPTFPEVVDQIIREKEGR
jgi:hypothetical protein